MKTKHFNDFFEFLDEVINTSFDERSYYFNSVCDEEGNVVKKVEKEYKNGKCVKDYTYEKTDEGDLKSITVDEKSECKSEENQKDINWYEKYLNLCEKYGELEVKNKELIEKMDETESLCERLECEIACVNAENKELKEKFNTIKNIFSE